MLKRAKERDFDSICRFCENSILGIRIICLADCYGFDRDFIEFWICFLDDELSAVAVRFDGDMTILSRNGDAVDELNTFAIMSGCSSFMTNYPVNIRSYNCDTKNAYVFSCDAGEYSCPELEEKDIRPAYSLISQNIPGSFSKDENSYLSFLSDFTFRKMRGFARGKGVFDGELIACAITSAETDTSALLSGIACSGNSRGTGAGKKVVLGLTGELIREGKKVYVIALNQSAEGFYEHIGFVKYESVYITKGKSYV